MKAIIVPGVTDMNKGDQALVWESHRLILDTGLYNEVLILEAGDNEIERRLLCQQSIDYGFPMVENILQHPRRGKHRENEHIHESKFAVATQIKNAGMDFVNTKLLLICCKNLSLVKKFFSPKVYRTVKHFAEADTVFVKGGGFIHAYGERSAPYLMWFFLFYVRLALKLNKKVVFLPNSYGPFRGLTVKQQVKSLFPKLDLIYARENVSAQNLGDLLGIKIPVEMDLGFFLKEDTSDFADSILKKYNLGGDEKVVGITIRPWRFPGTQEPEKMYQKYIISVCDLVRHVVSRGYKVALCNQSLGINSHEDDRNAIKDLLQKLGSNSNVVWINENLPCTVLKAVYSRFYFFVGTRFHSVIFSLTSLVPSIAIGYGGNKAQGIMGDFNLNEYVIPINEVTAKELIYMFDTGIHNYEEIKNKISSAMKTVNESRCRLISDIQDLYI